MLLSQENISAYTYVQWWSFTKRNQQIESDPITQSIVESTCKYSLIIFVWCSGIVKDQKNISLHCKTLLKVSLEKLPHSFPIHISVLFDNKALSLEEIIGTDTQNWQTTHWSINTNYRQTKKQERSGKLFKI